MNISNPVYKIIICTLFGVCGFLGNWYKVTLFFNVDFLLGSIFSILAIALLGRGHGIFTALIAGTCTYFLWNHPWAVVILVCEAAVVSWLYHKRHGHLVVYDLLYWIFLGLPLVYLFYRQTMGLGLQDVLVVMLKQSVNGICNTLVASLVLLVLNLFTHKTGSRIAYSQLLFAVMLSFALLPTILLSVSAIREYQENRMATLHEAVSSVTEVAQRSLAGWINEHHTNVQILASLVGDPNTNSFDDMQRYVEILAAASPALKGMGVFDERSVSVGYSPLLQDGKSTLGVDMSGRAHIELMKREKKPYITDMIMSRLGDPSPIAVLVAPVIISGKYRGYCSGVLATTELAEMLRNLKDKSIDITLLDGQQRVIVSTLNRLKANEIFPRDYLKGGIPPPHTTIWKPEAQKNISVMQQWRSSFLFNAKTISENSRWQVIAEASLQPVIQDISRYSLNWLTLQGLLILGSIALSLLLTNLFINSIQKLQVLSRSVTQNLDESGKVSWPASIVSEIDELSNNFQKMTLNLLQNISARKNNEQRITHINQVLDSIRLINKLIAYETDRCSLLQRACNLLVDTRGFHSAWATLLDSQGKPMAFAESGLGDSAKSLLADMECGKMPQCFHQAKEESGNFFSITNTKEFCSACPLAVQDQYGAALVGILKHNEREFGLLTVSLPPGVVDDDNELSLFGELTNDLGHALYSLEQEERRQQAEDLYSLLFSSSADGILIAEVTTKRFRVANQAICDLLGYSQAEILQLDVTKIHPQDVVTVILKEFDTSAQEKQIVVSDIPCLRKDGTIVYADITAVPIVIDGVQCLAGFFRDITPRKAAEKEKEKLEGQLLQALKMESIGRLAGGVAHDYNNMLNVIIGYTEMALEDTAKDQPIYEDLMAIFNAALRSAEITRQLLAFARRQTIAPVVLNLNDTVAGMLKMLHRLLGENISLSWIPRHGVWNVKMDPAQIDQILANLCVNARDAIADVGKITIETDNIVLDEDYCSNHAECTAGNYVMLTVSDTGCGMDHETLARIFEPYYTTKEIGKGTGLGMSTVYGIVKQNHGSISIYSEPGKGTTVKIYIPRYDSEVQTDVSTPAMLSLRGDGEKVLLVEDEAPLRQMGRLMLERSGYTVFVASSPNEALQIAREHGEEIELLLTDVVMPEMNGRELASRLREFCPAMKIVYMSGYTANAIAHHGVLDDGVNFIQKPFSFKLLAGKIYAVLHGQGD